MDVDDGAGMILIDTKDLQLLFSASEIGLGVLFRVFSLLDHGLRDGAVLEQIFSAEIGLVGQLLIVDGL